MGTTSFVRSCTIITTSANELLSPIHDRMPVILPRELESLWLDPDIQDYAALGGLLTPYPTWAMEAYEVSSLVNSPANDGPELVAPVGHGLLDDQPVKRLGYTDPVERFSKADGTDALT